MTRDLVLTDPFRESGRQALRHLSRIDEDERRAMLLNQRREAGVDHVPLVMRADVFEG